MAGPNYPQQSFSQIPAELLVSSLAGRHSGLLADRPQIGPARGNRKRAKCLKNSRKNPFAEMDRLRTLRRAARSIRNCRHRTLAAGELFESRVMPEGKIKRLTDKGFGFIDTGT